jgi:inosose dehydratase
MRISRRDFLAVSTAGIALGALSRSPVAAADASPYGSLNVGAQSYSFRDFSLERALKQYQTLGLKYGEFFTKHIPPESNPAQVQAILKLCKEYGVTPIGYGVRGFTKKTDANRKEFELAKALGVKYISADPDTDSFDSLDKLCDEYKIAIAIHPHGPDKKGKLHKWYSCEIILDAIKDHNPLIGTCIDTGHILRCVTVGKPLDPAQQIRLMGKRNFGLHLKDFDPKTKEEVIVGKGMMNVTDVISALKDVGFQGYANLEYELNPQNPTPDMAESLKVLAAAVKTVG